MEIVVEVVFWKLQSSPTLDVIADTSCPLNNTVLEDSNCKSYITIPHDCDWINRSQQVENGPSKQDLQNDEECWWRSTEGKLGQIENECWGGSANQCNKEDKIGSPVSLLLLCYGGSTINSLHGCNFHLRLLSLPEQ